MSHRTTLDTRTPTYNDIPVEDKRAVTIALEVARSDAHTCGAGPDSCLPCARGREALAKLRQGGRA